MNVLINSIRNILIPYLEQDSKYEIKMLNDSFCESFANAIIRFENDPKQVNEILQSLELANIGIIKSNISEIHKEFLNELAEYYVLGYSNVLTDYLLISANITFEYYVNNFRNIENSIKKTERNRLKLQLPHLHDRLVFELSDNEISNAFKKKGREDLKTKFKKWDNELVSKKTTGKTFYLNWLNYAIAACLIIICSLILKFRGNEEKIIYTEVKSESKISNGLTLGEVKLKDNIINKHKKNNKINTAEGIKLLSEVKDVKIIFKMLEEKMLSNDKITTDKKSKLVDSNSIKFYIFNKRELIIFTNNKKNKCNLIFNKKEYYLKIDSNYFNINYNKKPQLLTKIFDKQQIEILNNFLN